MMYSIPHKEYYKLYDASLNEFTDYFYSDDELIRFIARWFREDSYCDENYNYHKRYSNSFIEQCTCDVNCLFKNSWDTYYKQYILYDNYDRIINVKDFKDDAFKLFQERVKNNTASSYYPDFWWRWRRAHKTYKKHGRGRWEYMRRMRENYRYRIDPVPHTRKWRGGPSQSPPHTAKIMRMYANPDYKYFNRGSTKEIPQWWDDRNRRTQRSWKEQSKARHQWQRGKV